MLPYYLSLFVLTISVFVAFVFVRAIVPCCLVVSSPWWLPFSRQLLLQFLGIGRRATFEIKTVQLFLDF